MAVATDALYQRLLKSIQDGAELRPQLVNVGTVLSVGDGVARIEGLDQAMASELLEFPIVSALAPVSLLETVSVALPPPKR